MAAADLAEATIVPLPSIFDARTIDVTRDVMVAAFDLGRGVALDASQVERMGTMALHLMMSAARTAEIRGVAFAISGASDLFKSVVAELGMAGHFSQWMRA